jgi:2-keto-3-deoxy-L-fuconate dehydrogenase
MSGRLAGKRAAITAAGQGIGRATALAFAAEGASVWASDIDDAALASLAAEQPAITARHLDVTAGEEIQAMAGELGAVDILFNCAGLVHEGTILECDEADWERSFDVNVTAMYRLVRAFLPAMIAAGGASIVNVSSVASDVKGVPNRFAYSASKAAVIGLTKALAVDFVKQGIRCNVICPGTVHTPSWEARAANAPDPDQARKDFIARQPMGRLGTAEEVAALAVYLASDESAFTTGAVHVIDGAMSA